MEADMRSEKRTSESGNMVREVLAVVLYYWRRFFCVMHAYACKRVSMDHGAGRNQHNRAAVALLAASVAVVAVAVVAVARRRRRRRRRTGTQLQPPDSRPLRFVLALIAMAGPQ